MRRKPQLLAADNSSPPVQCLHVLSAPSTTGAFPSNSDGNMAQDSDTPTEIISLENRPLLAVVAQSEWKQYNTNAVYLFSIVAQKYIHTLTFPEQVLQVDSTFLCCCRHYEGCLCIGLVKFSATIRNFRDECKPGFLPSPLKISSRWLAISGAVRKRLGADSKLLQQ